MTTEWPATADALLAVQEAPGRARPEPWHPHIRRGRGGMLRVLGVRPGRSRWGGRARVGPRPRFSATRSPVSWWSPAPPHTVPGRAARAACVHRAMSNTDSGASRTPIPAQAEHW